MHSPMKLRHLAESELGANRKVGGNFSGSWHADRKSHAREIVRRSTNGEIKEI